jgi:enamine deaminase RidA (YjgF/YER057c/UK114 family)
VLRALSALEQERGGLDAVERILFLRGYVYARPEFQDHSRILDPASRLLHEIFGERGHHARSAVGVASLPDGGPLEIELMAATRWDSNYNVISIT